MANTVRPTSKVLTATLPIVLGEPFSFDQSLNAGDAAGHGTAAGETQTNVLILGAGLAGLTCAYRYAQTLGRPITKQDLIVLEREPSVGGRVRSLKIGPNVVNLGAVTFQPTAYPRYMALLDEFHLRERVRIIPRGDMVLGMNGRALSANNLALAADGFKSFFKRGVFTPAEAVQLLRFYFYMRRVTSPAHFNELLALHDRSVATWASQFGFSESVKRKFVEPFIAFTFSRPEEISAAFGVLLLGFNLSRPANLQGGMMQLPEAMAAKLGEVVETGAMALRVERDATGFHTLYRRGVQAQRIHSKRLVLALPAVVAARLVPEMRQRAAAVKYGNGSAALVRGRLRGHGKLHLWRVQGEQGTVLFGGEAQTDPTGRNIFNVLTYRSDETGRWENVPGAVEKLFDGSYETLLAYKIAPAVAAPQPNQKPLPLDWGDGLYMAGDCTGLFPSQEAAVSSGEEVARLILMRT